MRLSPRAPRVVALAALLFSALALGGCVMNASGGGQSDERKTAELNAPPPPDLVPPTGSTPTAPATDASGKPLVDQPLSNEAVAAPGASDPKTGAPGTVDYSCTTDADCAIKDVGNCCGYYPACVNVDSPTFPEQVKAECAKNDMMSVCGFRDLSGCQCVEGRCEGIAVGAEGPVR